MMDEDLSVFFDSEGWAVPCAGGGHAFTGFLNQPSRLDAFDQVDVVTKDRTLTAPTADVSLAGLSPGGTVLADGVTFPILDRPFTYSGCGRIASLALGTPTT